MEPKSDEEGREEKVRWSKVMKPETRISDHPNWPDSSLSSKIMSLNPRASNLRENIGQWPQKKKFQSQKTSYMIGEILILVGT